MIKKTIHRLLSSAGYDIRKTSHVGLNAVNDIKRIYASRPILSIFDVGAHIGETAVEYSMAFPSASIYCFEPTPDTCRQLSINVSHLKKVKPYNLAIGESSRKQNFFVNSFSATNSFLPAKKFKSQRLINFVKSNMWK